MTCARKPTSKQPKLKIVEDPSQKYFNLRIVNSRVDVWYRSVYTLPAKLIGVQLNVLIVGFYPSFSITISYAQRTICQP